MADDFIVEEESSNRTFLYVVGGMAALLVIGIIAIIIVALAGRGGENGAIEATNQAILAYNEQVTLTVARMETVAAYSPTPLPPTPTATFTVPPTYTPSPVPPTLTFTPVAQTPIPEIGEGEEGAVDVTESPGAGEATPAAGPEGPGGGQLPGAGLEMWGALVAAAILVVVIVLARRFRPAA